MLLPVRMCIIVCVHKIRNREQYCRCTSPSTHLAMKSLPTTTLVMKDLVC